MKVNNLMIRYFPYIKNSALYFGSSLFVAMVGVFLNPLFALHLTHEDYAILGYYSSFNLLIVPLLHFCLFSFYARQYYFVPEEDREILGNTVLLTSSSIGFVFYILFSVLFYFVHKKLGGSFPFFPYALLSFLQVYIANFGIFYQIRLRMMRQAKRFACFSIFQCILSSGLTVTGVVFYGQGAIGKLWGALIAALILSIYSLSKTFTGFKINRGYLKQGLQFCWPLVLSALFWYFLTGVDRVFLDKIGDIKTFGLYSVGIQIAGYLTIFYTTLNNTFEPDIYNAIAEGRKTKLVSIIVMILIIVIVCNLLFIGTAPWLISLLTADRYIGSVPFAQILALHNIAMACYYMVVRLIVGYGYVRQELLIRIIGALVSVSVFYVFINRWQFYGAAWGQVFSFTLLTCIGLVFLLISRWKYHRKLSNNRI